MCSLESAAILLLRPPVHILYIPRHVYMYMYYIFYMCLGMYTTHICILYIYLNIYGSYSVSCTLQRQKPLVIWSKKLKALAVPVQCQRPGSFLKSPRCGAHTERLRLDSAGHRQGLQQWLHLLRKSGAFLLAPSSPSIFPSGSPAPQMVLLCYSLPSHCYMWEIPLGHTQTYASPPPSQVTLIRKAAIIFHSLSTILSLYLCLISK